MLTALLLVGTALAGDVLLPTYTPSTMSDFGPSERLTEETLNALASREVAFVSPSEIQRRAGEVADGCADLPECQETLWRHFGSARLALIGSVTWEEGNLRARVRFHGPDDASPIEVVSDTFPEADIPIFAERVAASADELLKLLPPPGGAGGLAVAHEPDSPDGGGDPRDPGAAYDVAPSPRETGPVAPITPEQDELERRSRGMPRRAWKMYRQSGLSYADWKDRALVRAGSTVIEFHGGAVFGDVDRSYDVRVAANQDGVGADAEIVPVDVYQHETFVQGSTFMLGGSLGYVPVWWLEADLFGGFILGTKDLSTGWELYKDGERACIDAVDGEDCQDAEVNDYDPATAFIGVAEPRIRLLTVATGPVKPYVLLAANMRFYDPYLVQDLTDIEYPDRQGGLGLGFTGGGGIAFDAPGAFTGFLEVPWTFLITPQPFTREGDGTVQAKPSKPSSNGQLLMFRAGIGFRL